MQGAAQATATADVAASIKRPAAPTPHNTPSANKAQRRALKPRDGVKSLVRNASVAMTSPKLVGAIDQGTTSTRFILYRVVGDGVLQPLASHQMEHKQIYPKPGWCEHDPEEIYANTLTCIAKALEAVPGGATASDVACVGITNQRETTVAWSKRTGKPLHNAVVWLDMRTSDLCDSLTAEVMGGDKDAFRGVCGLPISTYFAGVKMRWLLDNCDAVKAAAAEGDLAFGTIDSWLLHKLTGAKAHVTDVTNASRTMLMDLATQTWHEPTAEKLGVPIDSLPSIVSCAEEYGVLAEGALSGVKLTGCLGDQHAATLGQRCDVGGAKNTYGTGCFMLLNTGDEKVESTHGLLTTMAWRLGKDAKPVYALEGSVAIAGAGVQWLRDNLGVIKSASDVEPLASSVPDVGGVYFVPAFSGLFAPRWRPDARGVCVARGDMLPDG
jgi:glycerol kinase